MRTRIPIPIVALVACALAAGGHARAADDADPAAGCAAGDAAPLVLSQVQMQSPKPPAPVRKGAPQYPVQQQAPAASSWGRVQGDTVQLNPGYEAHPKGKDAATVMRIGGGTGPGGPTTSIVLDVFCVCAAARSSGTPDAPGCILSSSTKGTLFCRKDGTTCGGTCKVETKAPSKIQMQ